MFMVRGVCVLSSPDLIFDDWHVWSSSVTNSTVIPPDLGDPASLGHFGPSFEM
jgi:hypothetical protein